MDQPERKPQPVDLATFYAASFVLGASLGTLWFFWPTQRSGPPARVVRRL